MNGEPKSGVSTISSVGCSALGGIPPAPPTEEKEEQIIEGDFEYDRKSTYPAFYFVSLQMFGNPVRCECRYIVDD
jgi:hypothetical protein